jgi:hypothetical protein
LPTTPHGTNRDWWFPSAALSPTGELPLIQDGTDYSQFGFDVEVLKPDNGEAVYVDGRAADSLTLSIQTSRLAGRFALRPASAGCSASRSNHFHSSTDAMAFKPIQIVINAKDDASAVLSRLGRNVKLLGATIAGYFGIKAFAGVVQARQTLKRP